MKTYPISRLHEMLVYDPNDGFLRWRATLTGTIRQGAIVGSFDNKGYIQLKLDRTHLRAHRVAWAMTYGEWPSRLLDHINGHKADNRICNLRLATLSQNGANQVRSRANTSGFKGVITSRSLVKPWAAQIGVRGRKVFLGHFRTPEEAHAAYVAAASAAFADFAHPGAPLPPPPPGE